MAMAPMGAEAVGRLDNGDWVEGGREVWMAAHDGSTVQPIHDAGTVSLLGNPVLVRDPATCWCARR